MSLASRTDVENQYGSTNVAKWADLNSNENAGEISARITWALECATAEINDMLKDGVYSTPLSESSVPKTIVRICAALAGVILYESRGVTDRDQFGKAVHALQSQRDWVNQRIRMIHAGILSINGLTTQCPMYPDVLDDTSTTTQSP